VTALLPVVHHGTGNAPGEDAGRISNKIACRERLGGLLRHYCREAV